MEEKPLLVKKLLYRRIFLTVLAVAIVVFGLASVVFEQWYADEDNIVRYIPAAETVFYWHDAQRTDRADSWSSLPAVWPVIGRQFSDTFFDELAYWQSQQPQELAYAVLRSDNGIHTGWLVKDSRQLVLTVPAGWERRTADTVQLFSKDPVFMDSVQAVIDGKVESLKKMMVAKGERNIGGSYAYVGGLESNEWPAGVPMPDGLDSQPWLINVNAGQLSVRQLMSPSFFAFLHSQPMISAWPGVFSTASLMAHNLDKADLTLLIERRLLPPTVLRELDSAAAKYRIPLADMIAAFSGPLDAAVEINATSSTELAPDSSVAYYWLVRTPANPAITDRFADMISRELGYQKPTPQKVRLPDGTETVLLKAIAQPVQFQSTDIAGRSVAIVYLTAQSYIFQFQEGDFLIMGNSLKMLNRYLTQQQPVMSNNECGRAGRKSLLFNDPGGQGRLHIVDMSDGNRASYTVCFH